MEFIDWCDVNVLNVVFLYVLSVFMLKMMVEDVGEVLLMFEVCDVVVGVFVMFVEVARRGFDGGDVASTFERDVGMLKINV